MFFQFFIFKQEKKYLIVELLTTYFYWKLAIMADGIGAVVGFLCYCIFAWILYSLGLDFLAYLKAECPELYRFKVLIEENDIANNSLKHCLFILTYISVIFALALNCKH